MRSPATLAALRATASRYAAGSARWRWLLWHTVHRIVPLRTVEIETDARCNRRCSYCPVSLTDSRVGQMSDALFFKVVEDLVTIGFAGTLAFHFYNEPLLDKRLERFIARVRYRLVAARLVVFTNGDALSARRARSLFAAGLDRIRVSLHDAEIERKMNALRDRLGESVAGRLELQRYYDSQGTLDNRGGLVDPGADACLPDRSAGCDSVMNLTVNYLGKVALCCNDYFVECCLGDLNEQSVAQVWQSSRALRRQIYLGRYDLALCQRCVFGTSTVPLRTS